MTVQQVRRKVATFYGLDPTPAELARLLPSQVLMVPTVGRRSLVSLQAWIEDHGLTFDSGEPVEWPGGRTVYDQPWREPPLLGADAERAHRLADEGRERAYRASIEARRQRRPHRLSAWSPTRWSR